MKITIDRLMNLSSIIKIDGNIHEEYSGIEFDTRRILEDKIFICFDGENEDGHKYAKQALEKGAKALASTDIEKLKDFSDDATLIHLKDREDFLFELTKGLIQDNNVKIIGITGSSGKTSTKEIVYKLFSKFFKTGKTTGNFNNLLGISHSVINSEEDNKFFITECGMNHQGELSRISEMIQPDIVVITNVGYVHSGNFESLEHITAAKLELAEYIKDTQFLIYNNDITELNKKAQEYKNSFAFGQEKSNLQYNITGFNGEYTEVSLKINGKSFKKSIKTFPFFVENYIAALATLFKTGIPIENISLNDLELEVSHRMQKKKVGNKNFYLDCYNSNPYSISKIFPYLNTIHPNWIVVLGDMKELGSSSIYWHQEMGKLFSQAVDGKLVCYGELACMFGEGALKDGRNISDVFFANNLQEVAKFIDFCKDDYAVFVKGSRSMKMESIMEFFN